MSRFCFFVVRDDMIQIEMSSSPSSSSPIWQPGTPWAATGRCQSYPVGLQVKLNSPKEFVRHFLGVFITHEERSVCWVGSNYRHFHSRE